MENQVAKWNEREEVAWLKYTVQPPLGVVKGDYYYAENFFGVQPWTKGHNGQLRVVKDDTGKIVFVEFDEITMDNYYNHYFDSRHKRRSDYGLWQASKERQAKAGIVLVDGMAHVERQILERQSLEGDFDLLTGASGSMRNILPLVAELAEAVKAPSGKRYYGIAEKFGYGLTGWLQVVTENGKIVSCLYDEVFADTKDEISYPELKQYFRQSKYFSPCFEEPFPPGWNLHAWLISFRGLMDCLNARVVETQNLLDIDGLMHVDGEDLGAVWDRTSQWDRPISPFVKGKPRPRCPVWNNYLGLAKKLIPVMETDGVKMPAAAAAREGA